MQCPPVETSLCLCYTGMLTDADTVVEQTLTIDKMVLQLFPQCFHARQHLLSHFFSNLLVFPKVDHRLNIGQALQQGAAP